MTRRKPERSSTDFFRNLYREPLSRTRDKTIARYDRAVRAGKLSSGAGRFQKGDPANVARGKRANAIRRAAIGELGFQQQQILAGKARIAKLTRREHAELGRKGARTAWSNASPEERHRRVVVMSAGKRKNRVAEWPFPDGAWHYLSTKEKRRQHILTVRAKGTAVSAAKRNARRLRKHRVGSSN